MDVTAIPRNNADFNGASNPNFPGNDHIQAIANVAAFHFGYIEQGGTSLYAAMSQKVTDPEVLEITLGIGGDEIAHFLEWVDFAGNGVQAPVAPFTDSISGLTFPNFFSPLNPTDSAQPDLPRPLRIHQPNLPHVAIIRPLTDKFAGASGRDRRLHRRRALHRPKPEVPQHCCKPWLTKPMPQSANL